MAMIEAGTDATLALLSVEAWSTHWVLHWCFYMVPEGSAQAPSVEAERIDLVLYEGRDIGGGGGFWGLWTMSTTFLPPLEAGASQLSISVSNPLDGTKLEAMLPLTLKFS